jgi:hypothetical protein
MPATASGTTLAERVLSAQNNLHAQARQYFATHPASDRANAQQHAQAVLNTALAKAALEEGPSALRREVVEPAEQAVQDIVAELGRGAGLSEERRTREWSADERLLDSKDRAEAVAAMSKMLEDGTPEQIAVRVEQFPRYCESRNINSDFVMPVLSRRPETADAAERAVNAKKLLMTSETNASLLRRAISENRTPQALISTAPFDTAAQ